MAIALVQAWHATGTKPRVPQFKVVVGAMVKGPNVKVLETSVLIPDLKVLAQLPPAAFGIMEEVIVKDHRTTNVRFSLNRHAQQVLGVYGRQLLASVLDQVLINVRAKIRSNVTRQKVVADMLQRVVVAK